jgi:hypothetical protein
MGRKGRIDVFPMKRCDHIEGGKKVWLRKSRPDGSNYSIPLIIKGERCENNVVAGTKCIEHQAHQSG